jgi:AP-2 complex subunit alpha
LEFYTYIYEYFQLNNYTFLNRFVCKNNGVLFENDLIQVGVKSEFRQNLGRIGLFYGNKTQQALINFQPQLSWLEDEQTKLVVQVRPVDSVLEAGAQIQQLINAECVDDYNGNYQSIFL